VLERLLTAGRVVFHGDVVRIVHMTVDVIDVAAQAPKLLPESRVLELHVLYSERLTTLYYVHARRWQ
jgi:hypothetical protein